MNLKLMLAAPALFNAGPAWAQAMTPVEYVKAAGAGDLYERTSSQIVLKTTADPRVRVFAKMMLAGHAKSTAEVKMAAAKSRVKAPAPMLTPAQAEMIAQLNAESGTTRDAAYIAQQRAAHGQALALQQAYAMGGTAPALKHAAAMIVPVVEEHIAMLKAM